MSKEKEKLEFESPMECPHCKRTKTELKEECDGIAFIAWELPGTTFVFYQCPMCNCIVGNIHAFENSKKMLALQKERSPIHKPKSNLYLPGNPKMN